MSFLVLLLAIVIEKFSALRRQVQRDGAWLKQLARLEAAPRTARQPWLVLALVVLLPVLVLHLAMLIIGSVAYGWMLLPVHLLVLIYSLGRGDVLAALGPFRDACRRGDAQAAVHVAERDLQVQADNEQQLISGVQAQLLWQAYQGFFAVIFWYALLGPVAALAYRLLALSAEKATSKPVAERAGQLRHAFDWIPVRLLAASFALVGNFAAVSRELLQELLNWNISAARLVARIGCVASEVPAPTVGISAVNSLDLIWELLVRSAIVWYAGFALWTLLF
ncbi:regulatory signaling modulator protein AmpE [Pseudomonas sp. 21LCFQ010]|uniref:regulatory signaling modulator protein AmpE n=1 Tax=Pseudomonas sp. 21LCFQ010 TaxID=2957506 RepID=UPI002097E5FE|nr:regulatory signaling modulator protein AmpE [Pseudomonas sp. 21LCFQ010]MCO8164102.1 regulatory signaling modulator protein AmpE [Pseudomonas sp. 21LCFQ010]